MSLEARVTRRGIELGAHNVKAAGTSVTLRHGRREEVRLQKEVAPERRAPVPMKACLNRAPGARAHLPIDKNAPLTEFERVSPRFPVFRILPRNEP